MRILVNTDGFAPLGGVERSTLQVSATLARRGHEIHLLHADSPGQGGLYADWCRVATSMRRVRGFTVEARRPWRTLHHVPSGALAARGLAPDVIYANRAEQLLWARAAATAAGAGLVVHLRDHPIPALAVRLLGGGDVSYVAVSEFSKREWVVAGLDPDAVTVVPNGVAEEDYPAPTQTQRLAARRRLGLAPDVRVVLCYGRLSADKGIVTLLRAWRQLPPGAPEPAQLVLVGDTDAETARELAVGSDATVTRLARRDDVTELLHAADLVVLPAVWQEPFGRVVIEAMSAGVPVVATRVGGIPEVLTGRFARGLVPPGDPAALAAAIERHLDWRVTEADLGAVARRHVRARFRLSDTVDGVEAVLRRAARRSSGVRAGVTVS